MKSAAKFLVACVAILVGLEATARLMIFGAHGLDPRRVGLIRDTHPEERVHFETDPAQRCPVAEKFLPGLSESRTRTERSAASR